MNRTRLPDDEVGPAAGADSCHPEGPCAPPLAPVLPPPALGSTGAADAGGAACVPGVGSGVGAGVGVACCGVGVAVAGGVAVPGGVCCW